MAFEVYARHVAGASLPSLPAPCLTCQLLFLRHPAVDPPASAQAGPGLSGEGRLVLSLADSLGEGVASC